MNKLKVFFLLGVAICIVPSIRAQSAEEMISNCKELSEAKISDHKIAVPQDFESGVCWGAFGTVLDAIFVVPDSFPKDGPMLHVCAPQEVTVTEIIQIFIAYTKQHPEQLHKEYFFVALAALKGAFPCQR
jgi:hypothetical protein